MNGQPTAPTIHRQARNHHAGDGEMIAATVRAAATSSHTPASARIQRWIMGLACEDVPGGTVFTAGAGNLSKSVPPWCAAPDLRQVCSL